MSDKPVPIDLVPYSEMLGDSREFLRVWAKQNGPVTCFINPVPIGEIASRWIRKFERHKVDALVDLKRKLESE